jgi:predicted nucleic acid binding AN1-type Zn finger protein
MNTGSTSTILSAENLAAALQKAITNASTPSTTAATATPTTTPPQPISSSAKRCCAVGCRAKLGLTAFPCACGSKFCALHRYPEEHACAHDFRADAKKELLKTMSSAIVAQKLEKV